MREKATRNPLKLQELIEQEQEASEAEGGREAASGYTSFNLLNPGGSPSVRPSVGGACLGRSTEPVPRTSVVSPPVAPKGGLRGGKRPSGWWNWKSEVSIFGTLGISLNGREGASHSGPDGPGAKAVMR